MVLQTAEVVIDTMEIHRGDRSGEGRAKAKELSVRQKRSCRGGRLAGEPGMQRRRSGQGGREKVGKRDGRRSERSQGGVGRGAGRMGMAEEEDDASGWSKRCCCEVGSQAAPCLTSHATQIIS